MSAGPATEPGFRAALLRPARRRLWVFSDLQQRDPENARRCMHAGGKDCLRQVSGVDGSALTQFDVASLENRRGNAVRSAVVEWYGGAAYGVFFRDHSARRWEKAFLSGAV